MKYFYRILNVFAMPGDKLSGNPLCVFEDARGLDDATMHALALQFNLSETTFILPSDKASARVRIFTPYFEMPFAGHPTLGTAQVVRELKKTGDALQLEMKAGVIPVKAQGNTWTLQATAPSWHEVAASPAELASMLSLTETDIGAEPLWIDTGSEQLVIPLKSADAVACCAPLTELLQRHGKLRDERFLVYIWGERTDGHIEARFFFAKGNAYAEDPATGSACANLGGWFVARRIRLPLVKRIYQGAVLGRPSQLELRVDEDQKIFVSGAVIELGCGTINL